MADRTALVAAFEEYARALLSPYDIAQMLHRLTDQVVQVLGVDGAGVSIARNGDLAFLAATDRDTASVEQHQATTGDGPCHRTFASGRQILVPDIEAEQRWPSWREAALAIGFRAAATLPLPVDHDRIGVLDLYCRIPHEWCDGDIRTAQVLANMASGYVLNATQLSASRVIAERLQETLDQRVIVEQATGVLCGRHGIRPDQARERLHTHARTFGVSMNDVGARVIRGDLRL